MLGFYWLMIIFFVTATHVPAQEPQPPPSDPLKESWKYITDDPAVTAARAAEEAASELFAALPAEYQQKIDKEIDKEGRALAALRLAELHLGAAKVYASAGQKQLASHMAVYGNLIEYIKLTLASIVEHKENHRAYRQLCKTVELQMHEQIDQLEEYLHTINGPQAAVLEPPLELLRRSRIDVLNRVLGAQVLTAPQPDADR